MTKREQITKRLVMFLSVVALALLMIWTSHLAHADDTEVPTTEIATNTDASPTDASTEVTTEVTTEVVDSGPIVEHPARNGASFNKM